MATILAFPRHAAPKPAEPGGVLCPPLGVRFPLLLRRTAPDPERDRPLYALGDRVPGDGVEPGWRVLPGVDPADGFSLILRLHEDEVVAFGYLAAVTDAGSRPLADPLITPRGTFTLITRPTDPAWPAPLLVYGASWASPANWTGIGFWSHAVDPAGRPVDTAAWCDADVF
jgi:hypothetical protein